MASILTSCSEKTVDDLLIQDNFTARLVNFWFCKSVDVVKFSLIDWRLNL